MIASTEWKHATTRDRDGAAGIAVFDDEHPEDNCDTLYKVYPRAVGASDYSPVRSVDRADVTHWTRVMEAWGSRYHLIDMRQDRMISLPNLPVVPRK